MRRADLFLCAFASWRLCVENVSTRAVPEEVTTLSFGRAKRRLIRGAGPASVSCQKICGVISDLPHSG